MRGLEGTKKSKQEKKLCYIRRTSTAWTWHLNELAGFGVALHQLPVPANIQHEVIMLLALEADVRHGRLRPQNLLLPHGAHGAHPALPADLLPLRSPEGRNAEAPEQAHGVAAERHPRAQHGHGPGRGVPGGIHAQERGCARKRVGGDGGGGHGRRREAAMVDEGLGRSVCRIRVWGSPYALFHSPPVIFMWPSCLQPHLHQIVDQDLLGTPYCHTLGYHMLEIGVFAVPSSYHWMSH